MVCPKCKAQLPPGAVSCAKCGTRFKSKVCPYCKSQILFSSTVCPKCGKPLAQASAAAPSAGGQAYTAKQSGGGFRWWYILIGLGIFILGAAVGAVGMRQYILSNVQSAFQQLSDSLNGGDSEKSTPPSENTEPKDSSQTESSAQSADSGILGDYEAAILSARKSVDYEGKPVIIVKYRFTNNSEENQKFMVAISDKAFQNKSQLEPAILAGTDESYNSQDAMKDVQPGGTLEVEQAYLLQDESNDVTVEASELISLSKEKLSKTFSLAGLQ